VPFRILLVGAAFAKPNAARAFATRTELAMGEVVQRFGWLFLLVLFSPNLLRLSSTHNSFSYDGMRRQCLFCGVPLPPPDR
jgi:hypothetical protein